MGVHYIARIQPSEDLFTLYKKAGKPAEYETGDGLVNREDLLNIIGSALRNSGYNVDDYVLQGVAEAAIGYINQQVECKMDGLVDSAVASLGKECVYALEKQKAEKRAVEEKERMAKLEIEKELTNSVKNYRNVLRNLNLGLWVSEEATLSLVKTLHSSGIDLHLFDETVKLIGEHNGLLIKGMNYYGDSQGVLYNMLADEVNSGDDEDNFNRVASITNYVFMIMEKNTEQKFLNACKG